jgi:hypothetical protein
VDTTAVNRTEELRDRLDNYTLLSALIERRSRRFGKGMTLNGGPLAYQSTVPPQPLALEEEAALAFAACGITGPIMGEMPYETGDLPEAGSGACLLNFTSRTVPSPDSVHAVSVVVINDEGAWLLRRPQDYPPEQVPELVERARRHELVALYERSRIRLTDHRVDVPAYSQAHLPFNKWAANRPGSTYFVSINEETSLYLSVLFMIFGEDMASTIIDDRNHCLPAGVGKFGRKRGGHLHDDPTPDRQLIPISYIETLVQEMTAMEQGMVIQNLALMTQALGLGGFPHFAAHPYHWFEALGFRIEQLAFSRTVGAGPLFKTLIRLLRKEQILSIPVGLERDGNVLLEPFCPPYYRNMEEAVLAFVDSKFRAGQGTFRDGGARAVWRDPTAVQANIPRYSDQSIAAVIAYCDYVYRRYGRFPMASGPFKTVLAYQVHHLDGDFYGRFYRPEALGELREPIGQKPSN